MITRPKLEFRKEQPYAAIRTQAAVPIGSILPNLWDDVHASFNSKGAAEGPAMTRYLTTNMNTKLDLEVGYLLTDALSGEGRISAGILPGGRYAVLRYTGPYEGDGLFKANAALMEWAVKNKILWQKATKDNVDWWGGRAEIDLTDPEKEPDSNKWQTELTILVAGA